MRFHFKSQKTLDAGMFINGFWFHFNAVLGDLLQFSNTAIQITSKSQSVFSEIPAKKRQLMNCKKAFRVLTLFRAGPSAVSKVRGGAHCAPLGF